MMDGKVFIDTNILIYASIAESPFHAAARQALADAQQRYDSLWISPQVIREFLVVMTHNTKDFQRFAALIQIKGIVL